MYNPSTFQQIRDGYSAKVWAPASDLRLEGVAGQGSALAPWLWINEQRSLCSRLDAEAGELPVLPAPAQEIGDLERLVAIADRLFRERPDRAPRGAVVNVYRRLAVFGDGAVELAQHEVVSAAVSRACRQRSVLLPVGMLEFTPILLDRFPFMVLAAARKVQQLRPWRAIVGAARALQLLPSAGRTVRSRIVPQHNHFFVRRPQERDRRVMLLEKSRLRRLMRFADV